MKGSIEEFKEKIRLQMEEKSRALAEALLQKTPVLLSETKKKGAIIHPSSKTPGRWQVSWWDTRGFFGDTTRNTKSEAVQVAVDEFYLIVDRDGLFRQISSSKEFLEGVAGFLKLT